MHSDGTREKSISAKRRSDIRISVVPSSRLSSATRLRYKRRAACSSRAFGKSRTASACASVPN
jgi:hypothetical protein